MNLRVLLGTDLSTCAAVASRLVAGLHWPEATTIRVLGVLEPSDRTSAERATSFTRALRRSAQSLVAPGRLVDAVTDVGDVGDVADVADVLVDEARRMRADLVVLGSRGRGPITSAVLGSVSARVVDEAPCPVLIARRDTVTRVIFGDDGATYTAEAADILTWPVFFSVPVHVISVAEVHLPFEDAYARIAQARAAELVRRGMTATAEVRRGAPASVLMNAAADSGADLIVVGSRGNRGVRRALTGSTARDLLFHAASSVLIAPGAVAAEPAEGAVELGWHAPALST